MPLSPKNTALKNLREIADIYNKNANLPQIQHESSLPTFDLNLAAGLAAAHDSMKHDPSHPDVKEAYGALKHEVLNQYNHLVDHGYKFTPLKPGQDNPYKNSKEMMADVHQNKHLWYYPTEQGFGPEGQAGDHPLLEHVTTKDNKTVPANDVFRAVHDVLGHAKEGFSFGPKGEEAAWREHMKMFSPAAQKALTAETRLQNHYVNYGPDAAHNKANPADTIYAEQKAGIPPDWALKIQHPKGQ